MQQSKVNVLTTTFCVNLCIKLSHAGFKGVRLLRDVSPMKAVALGSWSMNDSSNRVLSLHSTATRRQCKHLSTQKSIIMFELQLLPVKTAVVRCSEGALSSRTK